MRKLSTSKDLAPCTGSKVRGKETFEHLFHEMMEKVWDKATLDLSEQGMDFIKASKHIKEMQFNWHGVARLMDEALHAQSPRDELAAVLERNYYANEEGATTPEQEAAAVRLADYVMAQMEHLRAIPSDQVLRAKVTFGPMVFK